MRIFGKSGDFAAFVKLLHEGRERCRMRILGFCLMHNHWHLLLWPRKDGGLAKFVGWVSTTHVRRWREHRGTSGEGHLYQGRYKSFPVQDDGHFLTVLKYIEQNPKRAKMVEEAGEWPWSSASRGCSLALDEGPLDRPRDWDKQLDKPLDAGVLEALHVSVQRGRPFGERSWVERTVKKLGLGHTVRDPWRPRKRRDEKRRDEGVKKPTGRK